MITAGQILDFIMENRRNKVFCGYTRDEVAGMIQKSMQDNTILYAERPEGCVSGVLFFELYPEIKVIHVIENLAMSMDNLSEFAKYAERVYPGWRLEYHKNGTFRVHDTKRIYRKLTKV